VNQLAQLMGGGVTAVSTPQHGSTFVFSVPLPVASEADVISAVSASPALMSAATAFASSSSSQASLAAAAAAAAAAASVPGRRGSPFSFDAGHHVLPTATALGGSISPSLLPSPLGSASSSAAASPLPRRRSKTVETKVKNNKNNNVSAPSRSLGASPRMAVGPRQLGRPGRMLTPSSMIGLSPTPSPTSSVNSTPSTPSPVPSPLSSPSHVSIITTESPNVMARTLSAPQRYRTVRRTLPSNISSSSHRVTTMAPSTPSNATSSEIAMNSVSPSAAMAATTAISEAIGGLSDEKGGRSLSAALAAAHAMGPLDDSTLPMTSLNNGGRLPSVEDNEDEYRTSPSSEVNHHSTMSTPASTMGSRRSSIVELLQRAAAAAVAAENEESNIDTPSSSVSNSASTDSTSVSTTISDGTTTMLELSSPSLSSPSPSPPPPDESPSPTSRSSSSLPSSPVEADVVPPSDPTLIRPTAANSAHVPSRRLLRQRGGMSHHSVLSSTTIGRDRHPVNNSYQHQQRERERAEAATKQAKARLKARQLAAMSRLINSALQSTPNGVRRHSNEQSPSLSPTNGRPTSAPSLSIYASGPLSPDKSYHKNESGDGLPPSTLSVNTDAPPLPIPVDSPLSSPNELRLPNIKPFVHNSPAHISINHRQQSPTSTLHLHHNQQQHHQPYHDQPDAASTASAWSAPATSLFRPSMSPSSSSDTSPSGSNNRQNTNNHSSGGIGEGHIRRTSLTRFTTRTNKSGSSSDDSSSSSSGSAYGDRSMVSPTASSSLPHATDRITGRPPITIASQQPHPQEPPIRRTSQNNSTPTAIIDLLNTSPATATTSQNASITVAAPSSSTIPSTSPTRHPLLESDSSTTSSSMSGDSESKTLVAPSSNVTQRKRSSGGRNRNTGTTAGGDRDSVSSLSILASPSAKVATIRAEAAKRSVDELERLFDVDDKPRILLVEDNTVNAKLFMRMLPPTVASCCDVAANGLLALQLIRTRQPSLPFPLLPSSVSSSDASIMYQASSTITPPVSRGRRWCYDVIFMDINMPIVDGIECTQAIRAWSLTMPIIALTANAVHEGRDRSFAAGINMVCWSHHLESVLLPFLQRS
jgi:CheY-like chemotaxis protein